MYNLGIIGMSSGNGHPYSWAAIFNGYIVCPAHAIQPDTPAENIMAIYEAALSMQY